MQLRSSYAALVIFAALGIAAGCSSSGSSDTSTGTSAPATTGSPSTPPPTTPPATTPPAGATASAAASGPADGAALFGPNCSGCHGEGGAGGKKAPKLAGRSLKADEVEKIVTDGKGRMPAFGKRLSKDQIAAIAKYAATL